MFLHSFSRSLRVVLIAVSAFFLCSAIGLPATWAQTAAPVPDRAHMEEVLRGLNSGSSVGQVALAPDGKHLAWIQLAPEGAEIRVAPLGNLAGSQRISAAAPGRHCHEGEIAWSPNSATLVFFSDCAHPEEQTDLYSARLDGAPAHRLTVLNGYVGAPAFSPDGESIAFLYVEGATRPAGALAAMKPPAGVIGEDGVEIQRVAVTRLDVAAPNALQVTPANLHVFEFDWSPNSKSLA
ncbi:MAG: hypothetical protein P4K94_02970, partial [Terracidiphilus sp.]|nr:hypothetical protein [Terracidiphilus sp.]